MPEKPPVAVMLPALVSMVMMTVAGGFVVPVMPTAQEQQSTKFNAAGWRPLP